MFSRPKILFLVSLLFVALLNSIPAYLLNFEFFYHSIKNLLFATYVVGVMVVVVAVAVVGSILTAVVTIVVAVIGFLIAVAVIIAAVVELLTAEVVLALL